MPSKNMLPKGQRRRTVRPEYRATRGVEEATPPPVPVIDFDDLEEDRRRTTSIRTFTADPAAANLRLDQYLAQALPDISRARVQLLIEAGQVRVDGHPAKPKQKLHGGESIEIEGAPQPAPLHAIPEDIPLDILHEDQHLAVINKPAGMMVHAGAGSHRRRHATAAPSSTPSSSTSTSSPTSAATSAPASSIASTSRPAASSSSPKTTAPTASSARCSPSASVAKTYIALVHGHLEKDDTTVTLPIARDLIRRTRMTTRRADGRTAVSHFHVLERITGPYGPFTLVEVRIETGRTHQIRVHMQSLGHPVVGDTLYGAPHIIPGLPTRRSSSTATSSTPPTSPSPTPRPASRMDIHAPLPVELESFLKAIRAGFTRNSGRMIRVIVLNRTNRALGLNSSLFLLCLLAAAAPLRAQTSAPSLPQPPRLRSLRRSPRPQPPAASATAPPAPPPASQQQPSRTSPQPAAASPAAARPQPAPQSRISPPRPSKSRSTKSISSSPSPTRRASSSPASSSENFGLLDDGRPPVAVLRFTQQTNLPLRVGIMLDTSSSIRQRFQFEQDSAIEFLLQILHRDDRAFVEGFDIQTDLAQDFTNNVDLLNQGIRKLRPGGGTALFDALYKTCKDQMLTLQETGAVRRALILVSDGDDNYSRVQESDAIKMCQRADTIVYTISTNISPSKDKGDDVLKPDLRGHRRPALLPHQARGRSHRLPQHRRRAPQPVPPRLPPRRPQDGRLLPHHLPPGHRPPLPRPRPKGLLRPPPPPVDYHSPSCTELGSPNTRCHPERAFTVSS